MSRKVNDEFGKNNFEIEMIFFKEACKCVALLDGLIITEINGKVTTRHEHWGSEMPKFVKHLKAWGEAGAVKTKQIKTPTVEDRGVICMFAGHSLDHEGDFYRILTPKRSGW